MSKIRFFAVMLLVLGVLMGYFIYESEVSSKVVVTSNTNLTASTTGATSTAPLKVKKSWVSNFPFKLGLDLNGGSRLVYQAEIS